MRWQLRAAAHAVLSLVPGSARLHRRLQEAAGTIGPDEVLVEVERKSRFLARMREHDVRLDGASVLEIGTGWHPVLPALLVLLGARRVVTIDLTSWLSPGTLADTAAGIERAAGQLEAELGIDPDAAGDLAARLRAALAGGAEPQDALARVGIEARWPVDATSSGLPASSCDCVISSNVLEHVPPAALRAMAADWARILRPGGVAAHHVDPGDHFDHDHRITSVNFLRFSPRAWRLIGSGGAYHNRLRCPDYPALLERAGFRLVAVEVETDEQALLALKRGDVRPHATFARYSDEELAGTLVDVIARTPARAVAAVA